MGENTKIEWCDHTFNPWWGCTRISPGCDHCYAEHHARRFGVRWGIDAPRRVASEKTWAQPLKWNAAAQHAGTRPRVFCASMADVFDVDAPEGARERLWALIRATPNLDWLILTKRIGNAARMLPADWGTGYRNVWIGATIVNRAEMLRDGPKLRDLPARVRFWSVEPMLGDLGDIPADLMPHWVIVGGESGRSARPMHPNWLRSLRDQCRGAGRAFFFKQWGEWSPGYPEHGNDLGYDVMIDADQHEWPEGHCSFRAGKKVAGRLLDGVEHNAAPTVFGPGVMTLYLHGVAIAQQKVDGFVATPENDHGESPR